MTLSAAKMPGRAFSRLPELAEDWDAAVEGLAQPQCRTGPSTGTAGAYPSRPHEYMLYQALVGAWPDKNGCPAGRAGCRRTRSRRRAKAKEETNWTDPNEAYEAALAAFVAGLLDPTISAGFLASFEAFAARTALLGALNSLSQLALKKPIARSARLLSGRRALGLFAGRSGQQAFGGFFCAS